MKIIKNIICLSILISLISCKRDDDALDILEVTPQRILLQAKGETKTVEVKTNVDTWQVKVDDSAHWLSAHKVKNTVLLKATPNEKRVDRKTTITIIAGQVKEILTVLQSKGEEYIQLEKDTVYVDAQSNEINIKILANTSYRFNIPSRYRWIKKEKQITDKENPLSTIYTLSYSNNKTNAERKAFIDIENESGTIKKILTFIQRSQSDGNSSSFDYTPYFTDQTISQLKAGVTKEDIQTITDEFYKRIATQLLEGTYPSEFRIQEYRAWEDVDIRAAQNKNFAYSLVDNPTGISVEQSEELILFVGNTYGARLQLKVQNLDKPGGDGYGPAQFYNLKEGINKINIREKGLGYIFYHADNYTTALPIKIHIATGSVNGYYDSQKHTEADWSRLLNNAQFQYFDVLGQYAHLTFPTQAFKQYAASNGPELIRTYDKLVYDEQEFLGLHKYNRTPKNRVYFHVMYHHYMYSTAYRIAMNETTLATVADVNKLKTYGIWGPAHELGHTHQVSPNFKWIGMTEVTTNIQTLHIQTSWGNESRLETDQPNGFNSRYDNAFYNAFVEKRAFANTGDVFLQLVNFWQLNLYLSKVKGQTDFYKDLYEQFRQKQNPISNGKAQLEFVETVCEVAQLDLTDFFKQWGLLTPISKNITDNNITALLEISQSDINQTLAKIQSRNYPKPNDKITYITDTTVPIYKNKKTVQKGTANRTGNTITTTGWRNVVAYEVFEEDELQYVSSSPTFTLKHQPSNNMKVYAIGYNGEKYLVDF